MPALQYADSYVNLSVSNITPKLLDAGHFDKFDLIVLIFCTFHVSYLVILVYGQSEFFLLCWPNVNRQVLFGGLLTLILTEV